MNGPRLVSVVWTWLRYLVGRFLNVLGVPGVLTEGEYSAGICRAYIRVTVGPLFTVVTANGLDIYFHRLTGKIDGVGFSPAADYTKDAIPGSEHSVARPVEGPPPAHRRNA